MLFRSYLVYQLSSQNLNVYMSLPHTDTVAAAFSVASLVQSLLWKAAVLFVALGVVDLVWQRHKYMKSLRMSKQEIRDELKETEGNMEMKARIKRLIRWRRFDVAFCQNCQKRVFANKVNKPDVREVSPRDAVEYADAIKAPVHFIGVIFGR